jgi:hypothetical protein
MPRILQRWPFISWEPSGSFARHQIAQRYTSLFTRERLSADNGRVLLTEHARGKISAELSSIQYVQLSGGGGGCIVHLAARL